MAEEPEVKMTHKEQKSAIAKHGKALKKARGWFEAEEIVKKLSAIGTAAAIKAIEENGLTSKRDDVAECSALTLDTLGKRRSVPALIKYGVKHKNYHIQSRAISALGDIGDPRAVPSLIKYGLKGQHELKKDAARALGLIKDKRAVEPLLEALEEVDRTHERGQTFGMIVTALGWIGDKKATKTIIDKVMKKEGLYWQQGDTASKALINIGDKDAQEAVIKRLVGNNRAAAEDVGIDMMLGKENKKKKWIYDAIFNHGVTSPHSGVCYRAIEYLAEHGTEKDFDKILEEGLKNPKSYAPTTAVKVLGRLKTKKAAEAVAEYGLKHADIDVRAKSAEVLAKMYPETAKAALEKYPLGQRSPIVGIKVIESLGKIKSAKSVKKIAKYGFDGNAIAKTSLKALQQIGTPEAVEAMVKQGYTQNPDIKPKAADNIISYDQYETRKKGNETFIITKMYIEEMKESALEPLVKGLNSRNQLVKERCLYSLLKLRDKRIIAPLRKKVGGIKDDALRRKILYAMGRSGDPKSVKKLITFLDNKNNTLVMQAIKVLGASKRKEALKPLLKLIDSKDMGIKKETMNALGEMGDKKALPHLMKYTGIDKQAGDNAKEAIKKIQGANR